ncbi:ferric reductase like transmembrane component-domain-containing protein [Xylariaceae sp. FL1019]|nr:ferric reductase like transmembrane component-domain-containing protein [Xylariaceae sp. FL1019]
MLSSATVFLICVFSIIRGAWSYKNGIVGFGITMYPHVCCQTCHDLLSPLYLDCTTFDDGMSSMKRDMGMDSDVMGTTSDECRSSNRPWLQTMAYCIQQNCVADGYSMEEKAKCFSHTAVAGASEPNYQSSLPPKAPTVELEMDAMWLNATSLVNGHMYHSTYGTYAEFERSEVLHTRYAMILYLITMGACLAYGMLSRLTTLLGLRKRLSSSYPWSKLRQYVLLPALFGSRHLEPLPGNIGYVPNRALSISISLYIILNIVFSSISFSTFSPNVYWMSPQFQLCEYVGNRTGILSLVNLSISVLFAGRNNLLLGITGWSQTTFLTLHRWSARVATLQAIVHSIVYTLAYFEPGYSGASAYAAAAAQPFYWWGIIATIAFALATLLSILPLRKAFYESFLVIHICLAILALVGCWYHLVPHFGFDYGYQVWLYITFAFWSSDRIARLARVAYYNRFGDSTAVFEAIPDCNILQVTIFPRTLKAFGPGQHTFLYFPGLGRFWENHPFSIASWSEGGQSRPRVGSRSISDEKTSRVQVEETATPSHTIHSDPENKHKLKKNQTFSDEVDAGSRPSIRLMMRVHSGVTSRLFDWLSSPSVSGLRLASYNEGPYSGHRLALKPFFEADTVICIIGGLGITHALGFVQQYASIQSQANKSPRERGIMANARRFVLAWSAREMAFIHHVRRNFLVEIGNIERLFWCTDPQHMITEDHVTSAGPHNRSIDGVTVARMDIQSVLRNSLDFGRQSVVLVCGPGGMADEARREVVMCVKDGYKVDLVDEAYAW